MKIDLDKVLNREQAAAAGKIEGPELIIAGAGSGKTRMITYRIAHMLESGIDERNILALTFTNKAASEMSERIRSLTGKPLKGLTTTTFHSFGLGLLKQYIQHLGYHNDFTLYDANDNIALIKNCIIACGHLVSDYNVNTLSSLFSDIKTGRASIQNSESQVALIYDEWLKTQKAYNVVDFDDLILLPIKIFSAKPFVLEEVQERYRYIMVDEFQDTSLLQYRFVSMIAKKYRNLSVVGDDDQSIYSWRGANYQNIVMFEQDFPERAEFKLERNYRSTGNILSAANSVITNNKDRKEKKLWTEESEGAAIYLRKHKNGDNEAFWIVNTIRKEMRANKYDYKDFGVLVRTNSLISVIENSFAEQQLPVKISGAQSFFDRREIRDMLSYLKVLINKKDDVSLLRIINTPRRGIGRTTVERLRAYADEHYLSLFDSIREISSDRIPKKSKESLDRFTAQISSWRRLIETSPKNIIDTIVAETAYEGMLMEEYPDSEKAVQYKMKSISFLKDRLSRFIDTHPDASIRDYVNAVSVLGDENSDNDNKVNLMTMHASKGLEFKEVFLAGIEDNIIPSSRALEENPLNIDEERRLFYVAITRAREKLIINYAEERTTREGDIKMALPSRFLKEIPHELFADEEESKAEEREATLKSAHAFLDRIKAKKNTKVI